MQYAVTVKCHANGATDTYRYEDADEAQRVFHFFASQDGFTVSIRIENN